MEQDIVGETSGQMPTIWGKKIPGRNKHFTGREKLLDQLRASIISTTKAAVLPQALQGLGGVGKTQLAIEYAWRYRDAYDLVWWVPADQPMLVPSTLAALAEDLRLRSANSVGIEEAAAGVRDALQRGEPIERWLLIFDNADEPEDIRDFIPEGGPGHVLITSRNSRWSSVAETVPVDVFSTEESVAFLRKRLHKEVPRKEAEHLANELGDLPLALEQAAALQTETGMSTQEYVEQLALQTRELLDLGKSTEYPLSMTAAWQLSVNEIEHRLPEAALLLRCLAFFGPDPIPRAVFRRGSKSGVKQLSSVLANPVLLARAFGELNRFALVKIEQEADTVQIHRLVQALLRDSIDPSKREDIRHEVHQLLAGGAPADPEETTNWPHFADLIPHVRPAGITRCADHQVQAFAINVIRYLFRVANYTSARTFAEEFLAHWTATYGEKDENVLRLRRHLGNVLWQSGAFDESRALNEETFDYMREVFGERHEETLRIKLTFAANLRARGLFKEAFDQDTQSLELHTEVFGAVAPATLRVLNNLALDNLLLSRFATAQELAELVFLEQSSARTGVSKWEVQSSWNGLARSVRLTGNHVEACDVGEQAYAHGINELGIEHPLTLVTARDLSIARRRKGDVEGALELVEETYLRLDKLFGPDNPETMATQVAFGNTLRQVGRVEEAMPLAQQALSHYRAIFGDQHPFTNGCLMNLASLYQLRGDAIRARDLDRQAHEGLIERLGPQHGYVFGAAINLSGDLAALGDVAAARDLSEKTLTQVREFYGPDDLLTLSAAANVALDLRADGKEDQAQALYADTMRRYSRHPLTHPERVHASKKRRFSWDFDPVSL
ncbi:FxSxx-COOH system tetratricopeptide repeat protein [Nonomuraea sp. MCN248]|uniref:FxSxx-COOH system tetratricopeptide repeat protein n=1 Tax=Nonomuraea corallina TaxID=2989783 RepID=A0ABT4S8C4_9ACTN|nr:FxSxx-COOH system tetratricopeptide repeat protein [Nonomuraea corallina]MDA0633230.1 FxSxx-COOH system tetratricopeptide repeat protein [Nonomuraea corallina]